MLAGQQLGAVLGEWRCAEVVAGVVGDAQVRTDLDLEGKLGRVPLPNGGMEHHAKGLARSVRGYLWGVDEGSEQQTWQRGCLSVLASESTEWCPLSSLWKWVWTRRGGRKGG